MLVINIFWGRARLGAGYGHIIDPFGVTIIIVRGLERADVVRFPVVIPGDNLKHRESLLKHLVPTVKDQRTPRKDPIFAVRNLGAEVGEEPG